MTISIRETFEDVHSDLLGPTIPTDVQHFQADALVTGDLIRWNESVLEKIEDRSNNFSGTHLPGTPALGLIAKTEVGALMLAQGKCFRLLCDAPNIGLSAFPDMRAYNFPSSYMHDSMDRKRGARVERVHVILRALSNWTNIGATAALPSYHTLYNDDTTGKPGTAPN